ncbi:MAG: relaxase/mobilization nuclease domain-containing protein [Synergistaceae bacterium]|jgi:hypothetical protein|nr:relaxase/mobilization nuclease domain-containing protein [Synergistaceae bacterium]
MIGKHIPSPKGHSSFKGLNDYITGKTKGQPGEKIALTGCLNLASVETATIEMESLAFQNKLSKDPVMHMLLSWRENENPTSDQVREAVTITLGELNLSQCQAVYSLHRNTDNLHLHICVNRIDPETYRAIDPAHGWTRRAMEHAARRIEHVQGWNGEENTWSEINESGVITQKPNKQDIRLRQEVKDTENQTGEQSAIRHAQGALKGRIQSIASWDALHNLMRSNGMEYERKGSGAVIHVGDIVVKASSVSRNLSLAKLEKGIGAYQSPREAERPLNFEDTSSNRKPLDKSNDNADWRAYIAERGEYFRNKKSAQTLQSMTQRQERQALKVRQRDERKAMFAGFRGHRYPRAYVDQQRSALSTKHAYELALMKALHKKQREGQKQSSLIYLSFERWLVERGLTLQADEYRHRKDKGYIRLEPPEGSNENTAYQGPSGILGFTMTQTKQGARFASAETPNKAAFIDTGSLIRVYGTEENSLLAALQLAQAKWGGAKINGSDEYKRRCAEIAAKHGIRVSNPELQDLMKEFERKNRPLMSPEIARNAIAHEALLLRNRYHEVWRSYTEHKKALNDLLAAEPQKPKFFGLKKWKLEHSEWAGERDKLAAQIAAGLETLGVKSPSNNAEKEAEARHVRYDKLAIEEALRQNPDAAAIIREDDARIEREELERINAEEAKARAEKESYGRLRASILELAARFGEEALIITNAQDGQTYSGIIIGTAEKNGHCYAAQMGYDGHVFLHDIEKDDLPEIVAVTGKKVQISCRNSRIGEINEESLQVGRSRGRSR